MRSLKNYIEQHPTLKKHILDLLVHPRKSRPRLWLRCLLPLYIKKGKNSLIYRSVRKDLVPFKKFTLGRYSIVEDYGVLNNAVGDITIGEYSFVGMHNTIIGPVEIGSDVITAQGVVITGLNHNYSEISRPIRKQGITVSEVIIHNKVWIGANVVILPGVVLGEHVIVGAGSVVTQSVPPYSVVVGNPAKIIKQYNFDNKRWEIVN